MNTKNVALKNESHEGLERLALIYGDKNKGKMIEIMIDYFERTGADPLAVSSSSLQKQLTDLRIEFAKTRETTVSFFRQQEKGLLIPIVEQVNDNTKQLVKYFAEEPLTVRHLEELKNAISEPKKQDASQMLSGNNPDVIEVKEKANKIIGRAKEIFDEFIQTGQKSSLSKKITFEENIITMYKSKLDVLIMK